VKRYGSAGANLEELFDQMLSQVADLSDNQVSYFRKR
jgi:hypothetical protein